MFIPLALLFAATVAGSPLVPSNDGLNVRQDNNFGSSDVYYSNIDCSGDPDQHITTNSFDDESCYTYNHDVYSVNVRDVTYGDGQFGTICRITYFNNDECDPGTNGINSVGFDIIGRDRNGCKTANDNVAIRSFWFRCTTDV